MKYYRSKDGTQVVEVEEDLSYWRYLAASHLRAEHLPSGWRRSGELKIRMLKGKNWERISEEEAIIEMI